MSARRRYHATPRVVSARRAAEDARAELRVAKPPRRGADAHAPSLWRWTPWARVAGARCASAARFELCVELEGAGGTLRLRAASSAEAAQWVDFLS